MTEVRSDGRTGITEPGLDERWPGVEENPAGPSAEMPGWPRASHPPGRVQGQNCRRVGAVRHPTTADCWSDKPVTGDVAWGGGVSPARGSAACVIISLLNLAGVLEETTPLEVKKHLKFNHFFRFSYYSQVKLNKALSLHGIRQFHLYKIFVMFIPQTVYLPTKVSRIMFS